MTSPTPALLFAWPSSGRRETLAESVESFVSNLDGHGDHSPCLFALDGSVSDLDGALAGKLEALSRTANRRFLYSDRLLRERFVSRLPEGFDREALRSALLQEKPGLGVGSNRNAILLAGTGSVIVSTDDDVLCKPVVSPGHTTGVVDIAGAPPCDAWYYSDRTSLLASVKPSDINVSGEYRSFFGEQAEGILPSCLAACAGSYGDSGYGHARAVLSLEDEARAHLYEAGYERMRFSRELVRIPEYDVSGTGTFLMGMQYAVDARSLLPPFFPVGRNEDGFFALMLRIMHPGSRTLYPAFGFFHDPPETRPFDRSLLAGYRPPLSELLMALSIALVPPRSVQNPRERLLNFGNKMRESAALNAVDFSGLVHETWTKSAIAYAEQLESQLVTYDRTPPAWAVDIDELLENVYEHVREPASLFGSTGCGFSIDAVRAHADQYGRLLSLWPELVDYVRKSGAESCGLIADFGEVRRGEI